MGGWVGAGVSDLFYYETKFKITKKLFGRRGAGERGPKVSDFFTKNPNLKIKF